MAHLGEHWGRLCTTHWGNKELTQITDCETQRNGQLGRNDGRWSI